MLVLLWIVVLLVRSILESSHWDFWFVVFPVTEIKQASKGKHLKELFYIYLNNDWQANVLMMWNENERWRKSNQWCLFSSACKALADDFATRMGQTLPKLTGVFVWWSCFSPTISGLCHSTHKLLGILHCFKNEHKRCKTNISYNNIGNRESSKRQLRRSLGF
mgnify:CR=1 FL=1